MAGVTALTEAAVRRELVQTQPAGRRLLARPSPRPASTRDRRENFQGPAQTAAGQFAAQLGRPVDVDHLTVNAQAQQDAAGYGIPELVAVQLPRAAGSLGPSAKPPASPGAGHGCPGSRPPGTRCGQVRTVPSARDHCPTGKPGSRSTRRVPPRTIPGRLASTASSRPVQPPAAPNSRPDMSSASGSCECRPPPQPKPSPSLRSCGTYSRSVRGLLALASAGVVHVPGTPDDGAAPSRSPVQHARTSAGGSVEVVSENAIPERIPAGADVAPAYPDLSTRARSPIRDGPARGAIGRERADHGGDEGFADRHQQMLAPGAHAVQVFLGQTTPRCTTIQPSVCVASMTAPTLERVPS